MDVIDRAKRNQRTLRTLVVAQFCALFTLGGAGLWWYGSWRSQVSELIDQLRKFEASIADIRNRPVKPLTTYRVYGWDSATAFASADACDRSIAKPRDPHLAGQRDPGDSSTGPCRWKWRSATDFPEDPGSVISSALRDRLSVVILASVGHDDQSLLPTAQREFGTNFSLATRRADAVLNQVAGDAKARCGQSGLHCIAAPRGSPGQRMTSAERESARAPRLTVIVGGLHE